MAKIHMASSGFLDPIISTVKGVGFMRPYAIVEKWGGNYEQIHKACAAGRLPHMRLHNNVFVLVDFRGDPEGQGGKFYTDAHHPNGMFPDWTNSQYTRPPIIKSNPARDYLLRMKLDDEKKQKNEEDIPEWMKRTFNQ